MSTRKAGAAKPARSKAAKSRADRTDGRTAEAGMVKPAAMNTGKVALYAALGPEFIQYEPDVGNCTLVRKGDVRLPENIHYAWPDPQGAFLYVGTSEGSPYSPGVHHELHALRIDKESGALTRHGEGVPLRARPIHLTLDGPGRHILTAYNGPFATVHRIAADGGIGEEIAQPDNLDVGHYPHQIRVSPSNKLVIIVSRGRRATKNKAVEPGGLQVFDYLDGVMKNKTVVAPHGGTAFGPRHLDFHPTMPWVYVSLELQNQVQMFSLEKDQLSRGPLFTKDSLARHGRVAPSQMLGPIHVHPNGRFVYATNRASGTTEFEGKSFFTGGENTLAVYGINQKTGEPTLIQHIDTRGLHVRTFSIDPTGRMLVAAHVQGAWVRATGATSAYLPACLSTFRIGKDGKLTFVAKYDVDTEDSARKWLYWAGFISYGAPTVDKTNQDAKEERA